MGRGIQCLLCLFLAGASAAAPASAGAATVSGSARAGVVFQGTGSEHNRLTVTALDGGQAYSYRWVRFRDSGARLRARGACRQVDRHTARCPRADLRLRLGGGSDRATTGRRLRVDAVHGGPGDDLLRGANEPDVLFGEAGDDVLKGGTRDDTLVGGAGRDRILGGRGMDLLVDGELDAEAAPDVFDGGPSDPVLGDFDDVVSYGTRTGAVALDVAQGRSDDGDVYRDVEGAAGGSGPDDLTGDIGANSLSGGGGDDTLRGGGGRDRLYGGDGDDALYGADGDDFLGGHAGTDSHSGGAGDDGIFSFDDLADDVDCGEGEDIADSNRLDAIPGCEWHGGMSSGSESVGMITRSEPRTEDGEVVFEVYCGWSRCRGTVYLRDDAGRDLGSGEFESGRRWVRSEIAVPLTAAGVAAFESGTPVELAFIHRRFRSELSDPDLRGYRAFMGGPEEGAP